MAKIKDIKARQVLDSRGIPTVEADIVLEDGSFGRASVPSGASTGDYEAIELRDGDPEQYQGKSVLKAVRNVNEEIREELLGKDASNQEKLDDILIKLDGTSNKRRLGANAILAVSMAAVVAESKSRKMEIYEYIGEFSDRKDQPYALPFPMMNVFNGGKHAAGSTDFQEYMIVPQQKTSFADRLRCGAEVFQTLKKILYEDGLMTLVGDEGGFAPRLSSNSHPLEYIITALHKAGYRPATDVTLALDVAASELYDGEGYSLVSERRSVEKDELIHYYQEMIETYPVSSIEDPLDQDDFEGWAEFTKLVGNQVQIVGDDLYVTNVKRLEKGIEMKSSNAVLVKLNQIGTFSETVEAINLAHKNGMHVVISHRSGETEDTFISDLVVGMHCKQIKTGSLSRSERLAKYNRLLRIEEILNS